MLGGSTWWEPRICHVSYHHITSNPRDIDQSSFATGISLMPPEATAKTTAGSVRQFLKSAVEIIAICYVSGRCRDFLEVLAVLTSAIWGEVCWWSSQENWVTGIIHFPKKSQANYLKINCIPLIFWIVLTLFFVNIIVQPENKTERKHHAVLVKVPMEADPVRGVFDEYATTWWNPHNSGWILKLGRKEASKILCLKWYWTVGSTC